MTNVLLCKVQPVNIPRENLSDLLLQPETKLIKRLSNRIDAVFIHYELEIECKNSVREYLERSM